MGHMPFTKDDGGRAAAGFKGMAGDCVCRAVTIASGLPYADVYKRLAAGQGSQRKTKRTGKQSASARNGVHVKRKWFRDFMTEIGAEWVPTMQIGSGCKVHLCAGELPSGRLVVAVSGHYTAVIDGVLHDTWDCQRTTHEIGAKDGVPYQKTYERCVYGYWRFAA